MDPKDETLLGASRYMEAIYGGREITRELNLTVERARDEVHLADEYVELGADIAYNPRTGVVRVVRDDRDVREYTVNVPDGYWSHEGFTVRQINAYKAISLRPSIGTGATAQEMFGWPIYRIAILEAPSDIVARALEQYR